jgi:hypothetical protein|tara:strand:+ start:101 stop:328 length:228 start_codon:yes stop_codon:yes gene_type:complete
MHNEGVGVVADVVGRKLLMRSLSEDKVIQELESNLLCDQLREFVEAMRDEALATDEEIQHCVLKELKHILEITRS